ncbi:carbohydrate ABC transporter permease [Leadbettera azotonutricia]|nr:carbohydrate ABC transporter permease [Leadbettera azotonutricia]
MLFPFWFMFIGGFRVTNQIASTHFSFLPENGFRYLSNFNKLFFDSMFPRAFLNTVFVSVLKTIGGLFFASMAGFAFEKFDFPGRRMLFYFVVATMMIPITVTMVPLYVQMSKMGWINTFFPLVFPGMISAYGIFIMRQYIQGVPNEVIYYSKIDGCGDFRTFIFIILPMVQPGLVVLSIILFMTSWNDFMWPMIILNDEKLYTITVTLRLFQSAFHFVDYGTILGGSFISALPMIIIFILLRERLLTGLVAGSVK